MTEFLDQFFRLILGFGLPGLFLLAVFDSTIIFFLPFAVDAILIILVSQQPGSMPFYALVSVAGSLAGCVFTFLVARKASEQTLDKKISAKKLKRVKDKIKNKGFAGLIITSLLPPPFPFSPFVVAAAVSKVPRKKAFAGIAIGRTIRYFAEGFLAIVLGRQVLRLLDSNAFKAVMLGLFVVAAVGTALSIYHWVRK